MSPVDSEDLAEQLGIEYDTNEHQAVEKATSVRKQ